jgi:hypothetical protein
VLPVWPGTGPLPLGSQLVTITLEVLVPEYYSSFGEAVAAAMQHNIRLAYSDRRSPPTREAEPSQDRDSVPEMIVRVTENAGLRDVAGVIEEVNGALTDAMPQLVEFVSAVADRAHGRLDYDDRECTDAYGTWSELRAAHRNLNQTLECLDSVIAFADALPARPASPAFAVLRAGDQSHDAVGAGPGDQAAAGVPNDRQRAALATSPQAAAHPAQLTTAASPAANPGAPTTARRSR